MIARPFNQRISTRPDAVLAALLLFAPAVAFGQQFVLATPGDPALNSTAVLANGELVVTDARGTSHRYVRAPQFDTRDGRYTGYFHAASGQALRWPAAGQGSMFIGDARGAGWRASRQQVQAAGRDSLPVIRPAPVDPAARVPSGMPTRPLGAGPRGEVSPRDPATVGLPGVLHVATGVDRHGSALMATIDVAGLVQLYEASDSGWGYGGQITGLGLVPGAPLVLTPDVTPHLPRIFTINANGALVMLAQGQVPIPFAPAIQFPAGASLTLAPGPGPELAFGVDSTGRLWSLDLHRQAHHPVDSKEGQFAPGSRVEVLARPGPSGLPEISIFVTDVRGTICRYVSTAGTWAPREELAYGFVPGGPLGAALVNLPNGATLLALAAVDWHSRLQFLSGTPLNLQSTVVEAGSLAPGAAVLVHNRLEGLLLSGVGADGVWRVWTPGVGGAWDAAVLYPGFAPSAPIVGDPLTGGLIAVDVRGRIVPADVRDGAWTASIHHPQLPQPPRLVSREVIPNPALPPARATLMNSSEDELVVQVADVLAPANSHVVTIPVGGSQPAAFERDAGAIIEETYLAADPLGNWIEHVERYPLPPRPRYSLAVWAHRTTYQYINKNPNKPAGALPDFDLKSHVSLGVIDLPPGELLRDGTTIDVFRQAAASRNAGAMGGLIPPTSSQVAPK